MCPSAGDPVTPISTTFAQHQHTGRAGSLPPQSGDGQRPHPDAGCGVCHATGLLRRLAERVFRIIGCDRRLREMSSLRPWGCTRCTAVMLVKVFPLLDRRQTLPACEMQNRRRRPRDIPQYAAANASCCSGLGSGSAGVYSLSCICSCPGLTA
jgi:hypothetical protein